MIERSPAASLDAASQRQSASGVGESALGSERVKQLTEQMRDAGRHGYTPSHAVPSAQPTKAVLAEMRRTGRDWTTDRPNESGASGCRRILPVRYE